MRWGMPMRHYLWKSLLNKLYGSFHFYMKPHFGIEI